MRTEELECSLVIDLKIKNVSHRSMTKQSLVRSMKADSITVSHTGSLVSGSDEAPKTPL